LTARLETNPSTGPNGEPALEMTLAGRLDATSTAKIWRQAVNALAQYRPPKLIILAHQVEYMDGAGFGLLLEMARQQQLNQGEVTVQGLAPEFQRLYNLFDPTAFQDLGLARPPKKNLTVELGRVAAAVAADARVMIAFVGELSAGLARTVVRPGAVRWRDAVNAAETAGVNALPIVILVSFLVGLIMAFQAAIPMKMFAAEIYVANLIALSMVRELGPLMTAIVLTGRSGSAFAAELGTMTVNEEIDALNTMGLDPIRFLVVPRVIAAVAMTPLLTVFANLVGIIGGAVVLLSLGYPLITYVTQVAGSITYVDFLGGLFKSFVFGILIAGIGCLRGLQTTTGASAVGESTTRAVVSGIVMIVITDGVFSVAFYYLGI
jgi:phospholipid/cholesterol/gamma-HCH transport system permease protein